MEDNTMEEPILSQTVRNDMKIKDFKEYLVKHDVLLAIIKFLLSLRNSNERPENPLNALNDYFGQYRDPAWDEYDQMKENITKLAQNNLELEAQIEKLRVDIQKEREAKAQRELEAQQRELEAQQKKDAKKPPAKK